MTAFSSFHNLGKLDRTSAVVSERAPTGKWQMTNWPIRTRVLSKLCYKYEMTKGVVAGNVYITEKPNETQETYLHS